MASFAETKTEPITNVNRNSFVIQATSKQDRAWNGISENGEFEFIAVSDSHGSRFNKEFITKYIDTKNWSSFLQKEDWVQTLVNETCNTQTYGVGATFTLIKIYPDHFECYWIGDSTAKIYMDEELIFQTKDHCNKNKEEVSRLVKNGFRTKNGWDIHPINSETLISFRSKIFSKSGEGCNMTRTLGHRGIFNEGVESPISITHVSRDPEKKYKIIAATDGLWGMVAQDDSDKAFILDNTVGSEELSNFANTRWNKAWTWDNSLGKIQTNIKFPKTNIDDVGVSVWSNY